MLQFLQINKLENKKKIAKTKVLASRCEGITWEQSCVSVTYEQLCQCHLGAINPVSRWSNRASVFWEQSLPSHLV